MHGSGPKLVIIAKKEMMGDEMPDFDGDSFLDAKKKMVKDDDSGDDKYSDDPHMVMKEMAKELYKASNMHSGQADKLMEICEQMYGDSEKMKDDDDEKPHKSYGDHNPYGSHKNY
tara:strand:+ start:153 stop:497 length:345 start_codon:yes stop_codon:yes gene_type:complete